MHLRLRVFAWMAQLVMAKGGKAQKQRGCCHGKNHIDNLTKDGALMYALIPLSSVLGGCYVVPDPSGLQPGTFWLASDLHQAADEPSGSSSAAKGKKRKTRDEGEGGQKAQNNGGEGPAKKKKR
jgi:hypothetical protein